MVESLRLKLDDIHNPGPGFVPFFLGLSLAILAVVAILSPERRARTLAFWNDWKRGKNIFFIFAGLLAYLLLFKTLGFFVDTFLLMVFLMKLSGEKGFGRTLTVSLVTVGLVYVIFYRLLMIPFPKGVMGI
jgi:putative tricarboxylic transport membrane protein